MPDQGVVLDPARDLYRIQRAIVQAVGGSALFWDLLEYGSDGWRLRGIDAIASDLGSTRQTLQRQLHGERLPTPACIVGAGAALVALYEYITVKKGDGKITLACVAKSGGWASEFTLSVWCSTHLGASPRELLQECEQESSLSPLERRIVHFIETRKR